MVDVLITGSGGFIGHRLGATLARHGHRVRRAVRSRRISSPVDDVFVVGDIDADTDWRAALDGVEVVVHLAARAHVLRDAAHDPLAAFRRVNVAGTLNLAHQAVAARARRLVLLSSIGVNGAATHHRPFAPADPPAPHSPYALSKHEAEMGLKQVAHKTGLQVVVIRPPLVFGPHAPGNFGQLVRCLRTGLPLPLGAVNNRRSFVAIDNLVDLIETCTWHENAVGRTLFVSDGDDMSTPDLLRRLSRAMGKPVHLLPIPPGLLLACASLLGRKTMAQQLCGSLQVDISETRHLLGWSPPLTVDEGLRRAVHGFPD